MSAKLAIADLIATLKAVDGLHVVEELQAKNRNKFTLSVTQGERETFQQFGAKRVTQFLVLELQVKAPRPGDISDKLSLIDSAITADRRRSGNAQSTLNTEPWTIADDQGREGVQIATTVGIIVYES